MGSYYKRQKQAAAPRYVTRAPWLYHTTLPDLLPSIREQGLRPLRDVASRLARDAAEKGAADAGTEVDPDFVHLYPIEGPIALQLLCAEIALLRVRTGNLDPAFLTRDPNAVLALLRTEDALDVILRHQMVSRFQIPRDVMATVLDRLRSRRCGEAMEHLAPFIERVPARLWESPPFSGSVRYAGIIPGSLLEVLQEFPAELAMIHSVARAAETPLELEARRWAPLPAADLAAVARGLGRTEFPADA